MNIHTADTHKISLTDPTLAHIITFARYAEDAGNDGDDDARAFWARELHKQVRKQY